MIFTPPKAALTALFLLLAALALPSYGQSNEATDHSSEPLPFSAAELDGLLAPIALYPDSLLTQILIASGYPLQVIAADRWLSKQPDMSAPERERRLEQQDWDPSVKALTAFAGLLQRMSEDLIWLEQLGDAFMLAEADVLDRVQYLRLQAISAGNLQSNANIQVRRHQQQVVIQPVRERVLYVPYYDSHRVYGHWHHNHPPYHWRPPHWVSLSLGIHWGPQIYIHHGWFFGDLYWHHRRLDRHKHRRHHSHKRFYKRKGEYQRRGYVHKQKRQPNKWKRHHSEKKRELPHSPEHTPLLRAHKKHLNAHQRHEARARYPQRSGQQKVRVKEHKRPHPVKRPNDLAGREKRARLEAKARRHQRAMPPRQQQQSIQRHTPAKAHKQARVMRNQNSAGQRQHKLAQRQREMR